MPTLNSAVSTSFLPVELAQYNQDPVRGGCQHAGALLYVIRKASLYAKEGCLQENIGV
jgi:hypothetical protein